MAGRKKSRWAERRERAAREPPVETHHLVGFGVIAVIFTLLYLPLMNIMAEDYRGRHALQTRGLDATAQVRAMWITTGGRRSPDMHHARIAFLARDRGEVIQDVTAERDDVDRVDDDADVPVLYDPADLLNVRINLDDSLRKQHPLLVTILSQIAVTVFVLMLWTAWIIVFRNWLRARREGRS